MKLELGTREPMQTGIGFRAAGSPPDLAAVALRALGLGARVGGRLRGFAPRVGSPGVVGGGGWRGGLPAGR